MLFCQYDLRSFKPMCLIASVLKYEGKWTKNKVLVVLRRKVNFKLVIK